MAIRFYDNALANKIKSWIKDPNLRILKPDETDRLFKLEAESNNKEKIQLPLIALSRGRDVDILSTNKRPLSFDGKMIRSSLHTSASIDAIPISIQYQLDIYTKNYAEGDEYIRDFIFKFINHPKLEIVIPYNDANFKHESNIRILSPVSDTSDIKQRLFTGQFTRWSILLEIDDAYLFSVPFEENIQIGIENTINI